MTFDYENQRIKLQNGGRGYNFDNAKGRAIGRMIDRIERDRNWSRAIFGLPLIAPVKPEIRRYADWLHGRR